MLVSMVLQEIDKSIDNPNGETPQQESKETKLFVGMKAEN
jgi:hypothetical protein